MLFENMNRYVTILESENRDFVEHLHHEVEIRICTEGTLGVVCAGKKRVLCKGDLMIAFSNQIHEYFSTEQGRGYMLIFSPDLSDVVKKIVTEYEYDNYLHAVDLIPLFDALYKEHCGDRYAPLIYGYVHTILASILKSLPGLRSDDPTKMDILSKGLKLVSKQYTTPLTLMQVAKRIGVSHNHLSRLFSQNIPGGFNKYLRSIRVHHACELLARTELSIYEVMYRSGFSNLRTFYRAFKSETGYAPKEYKINIKKDKDHTYEKLL